MPGTYYDDLTEFLFKEDQPEKSELIFIPGSGYGELGLKAAELWKQGMADRIFVSGKYSKLLPGFQGPISPEEYRGRNFQTEADFLAEVMIEQGVPEDVIVREREATFTYENAIQCRKILENERFFKKNPSPKAILVCQAFHARRSYMYYQYVFPEITFYLCPAQTQEISRENWQLDPKKIDIVLGEAARIGTQFTDIMKGTDKVWNRENI
ncbi:MAG: YdcF family protein [Eubacteriales bacterium]|nr:YdcF family protein [Eubacteriales bacterium]